MKRIIRLTTARVPRGTAFPGRRMGDVAVEGLRQPDLRTDGLGSQSSTNEANDRAGATLSEALVALLIMSIGLIGLASIFPIAVMKTARANQLTISTDIRYNAEAMMKVYPWIFSDPNPADTGPYGVPNGVPFDDYDFATGRPFLFDPHGCVGAPERPVPLPGAGYPAPVVAGGLGLLPRYGAGFNASLAVADTICSGPDTWSMLHDSTILSNTAFQMDVSDLANVNLGAFPGPNQLRVQIYYNGGRSSLTRFITAILPGNILTWTEDVNGNSMLDAGEDHNGNYVLDTHALPAGLTYETARLESRERRYTWLLTVRPEDATAMTGSSGAKPNFDVDVVVYYGRGFTLEEEQVYGTPTGTPAPTVANLLAGSTAQMNAGTKYFRMTWPTLADVPVLKRGGYLLDVENGYWYQIENYSDTSTVTYSDITLTTNIIDNSNLVVVPRGVVDVFPIKAQSP